MTVLSAGTYVSRDLLEDSFASQDPSDDNNGLFLRAQHVGTGYEKPYGLTAMRLCSMIQGIPRILAGRSWASSCVLWSFLTAPQLTRRFCLPPGQCPVSPPIYLARNNNLKWHSEQLYSLFKAMRIMSCPAL